MNNRERELSFGDVLAEALVMSILSILQILIIISNLEEYPN